MIRLCKGENSVECSMKRLYIYKLHNIFFAELLVLSYIPFSHRKIIHKRDIRYDIVLNIVKIILNL